GVGAGLAGVGGGEEADLLVVSDRPRRRAGEPGDVADLQRLVAHGVASISSEIASSIVSEREERDAVRAVASVCFSLGRSIETPAPITEIPARTQRAVCM